VQLPEGQPAAPPAFERNLSPVLSLYRRHDKKPLIDREKIFQYYALPPGKPLPANTFSLIGLAAPDGSPLLLERRLGAGHSLLLTTSPQGDWSEWSQRATWPVLLFAMTNAYTRGWQRAHQFTQSPGPSDLGATITVPSVFRSGTAVVTLPDRRGQQRFAIDANTAAVSLPTHLLGLYRVQLQSTAGERQELLYAVNFDPAEYGLQKMDEKEVIAGFAPDRMVIVNGPSELQRSQSTRRTSREEIGAIVGVALLLLLVGESLFSNRFYRTPKGGVAPPPPLSRPIAATPPAPAAPPPAAQTVPVAQPVPAAKPVPVAKAAPPGGSPGQYK
jgi:hypothetical protein